MSEENKEQELSTEATATTAVVAESAPAEVNERDARRGSRERAPRGERREREETKSQFLERVVTINRVSKVVQGGRRFSFTALMVIGDGKGNVGLGYGKAKEAGLAVQKGIEEARKNLFEVPLAGSTIVYPVLGEAGAGRVLMKPAAPGTGVIAGGAARAILEMAGVKDIIAKSLGSSNGINVAHATIEGLKQLRRPEEIAASRDKTADHVIPSGTLRAYRERQRDNDLFKTEA